MRWYLRYPFYVIVFLSITLAAAYGSFHYLSKRLSVEMPDLVGRSIAEVRTILGDMAIDVKVSGEEYDRSVPAGSVLQQSIKPATRIRGQAEVRIVLSKGPEIRLIPSAIGLKVNQARRVFEGKDIVINRIIEVHSPLVPKGTVIAQKPDPEKWTGENITLVASAGQSDVIYYTPLFVGMHKVDALMLASELGFSVEVKELDNTEIITHQEPEPGAEVEKSGTLRFRIGGDSNIWP